jgi:1,4-dihydroxy-2-naphthoate octaprenyltransferase
MIKKWISAFRLKTLPLSFSCILVGNFLGFNSDYFSWTLLGLAILTTLFLQILSNLANDLGDAMKGVDNEFRIGPERAIQSGKITVDEMKIAVIVFSILSLISGLGLIFSAFNYSQAGWLLLFFFIGLAAIAAAIFYTVGKKPYGYRALGDLFVLVFFGWVGVLGSNFLQTKELLLLNLLPATSIGLMAVGVLNMNNIRDLKTDKSSGKITIPVLLGAQKAKIYHAMIIVLGLLCLLTYSLISFQNWWQYLYFLITIPFFINLKVVFENKDARLLNPELKRVALTTFFISLGFSISLVLRYL